MFPIQILLVIFLLFALSRVVLRFRGGQITLGEFLFWGVLFSGAIVGIILPDETTKFANALGITRGVDLVVYASIVALFYLVFRVYVAVENLRHEITGLVRKLALDKKNK